MAQYNGIVAALVMRDASQKNADYISLLDEALRNYSNMEISLRDTCLDSNGVNRADSIERPADSCSTLLQIIAGHKRELLKNNDDIISTKTANLQQYYDKYLDGQINKTPQLARSDRPLISEYFYRPAVGAAVALAPFVLFRAGQILLGNENPSGTVTGRRAFSCWRSLASYRGYGQRTSSTSSKRGFSTCSAANPELKSRPEPSPRTCPFASLFPRSTLI